MDERPNKQREERHKRQTAEIHAAIGRYVEAFEQVVDWLRHGCNHLTCLTAARQRQAKQQQLMNVVFNHNSMTAGTLKDLYRALVGHIINDHDTAFTDEDRRYIRGVLLQFDKDLQRAIEGRNNYLHGTWFIGYGNEATEDWSKFFYKRGKTTKDGLKYVDGPKSASDIEEQTKECQRLSDYFLRFDACFTLSLTGDSGRISRNFEEIGKGKAKQWVVKPKAPTS